ncbi:MAG TPA: hypothetical protein VFI16_03705 [Anaeromyxobacteraceae bacterium]|nr:hypothetical protein [Anaeromyxobacteraceae bacterium]
MAVGVLAGHHAPHDEGNSLGKALCRGWRGLPALLRKLKLPVE